MEDGKEVDAAGSGSEFGASTSDVGARSTGEYVALKRLSTPRTIGRLDFMLRPAGVANYHASLLDDSDYYGLEDIGDPIAYLAREWVLDCVSGLVIGGKICNLLLSMVSPSSRRSTSDRGRRPNGVSGRLDRDDDRNHWHILCE